MDKPIINEMPATDLKKSDFFYDLPQELIAQHPAEKRDGSRLMVIDRATGEIAHRHFFDIAEYIRPEDTLVINDSKVIPARLFGHSEGREEASVELLLLRSRGIDEWETLVKPGKRARVGAKIVFGGGELVATVTDIVEEGNRMVQFDYDRASYSNVFEILQVITIHQFRTITTKCFDLWRSGLGFRHPIFLVKRHLCLAVDCELAGIRDKLDILAITVHCRIKGLGATHTVHTFDRNSEFCPILCVGYDPNDLGLLDDTIDIIWTYKAFEVGHPGY